MSEYDAIDSQARGGIRDMALDSTVFGTVCSLLDSSLGHGVAHRITGQAIDITELRLPAQRSDITLDDFVSS